ncbi:ribose-phosphate diphosphokinase [Candidatus Bathyarchaeota archaeon]|nr:ribose-phosphate diphosphokinase [Desulfobacterales bacterium]NIU81307.1 ribose-phosphate diphosphokinase [Candidatus Bathyarchaeota archaeon]
MKVIPGPASQKLGRQVAELLEAEAVHLAFKRFPDGESYIRLKADIKGEEVALIQTTSPPQDTHLMQLLIMIDAAKDLGARKIVAVVPYLAYARQDKRFLDGEAVSIETIIKLLQALRIDGFLTVNTHEEDVLEKFEVSAENLSAIPILAQHLMKKDLKEPFALAPDQGASGLAKEAAKVLGGDYGWLRKERDRLTGEISMEKKGLEVEGRDVVIFDDIISTGGTMATASQILKKQGARRVFAACVHPLLVEGAKDRILRAGAEQIIGTDCVPSPVSVVSVAPLVVEALAQRGS